MLLRYNIEKHDWENKTEKWVVVINDEYVNAKGFDSEQEAKAYILQALREDLEIGQYPSKGCICYKVFPPKSLREAWDKQQTLALRELGIIDE